MKILNFGSLNLDFVYEVDHFVRPGETISSLASHKYCGGKGLNQSIALARSGAQVYHAGAVGAEDGAMLLNVLRVNNVDTKFVEQKLDVLTGHAIIQVDKDGQNCILLYGGANQSITCGQVDETLRSFSDGDVLLLQNEINELAYIMEQAYKKRLKIVLNPSPMNEKILRLPLELVDTFILNEIEADDICGKIPEDKRVDTLAARFPEAKIVLTLGENGVIYKDRNKKLNHGIYRVPVVDTTAAGDTFTGFFIGSLAMGHDIAEALRLASLASSIAVSRAGAESSIPFMKEVIEAGLELDKVVR